MMLNDIIDIICFVATLAAVVIIAMALEGA